MKNIKFTALTLGFLVLAGCSDGDRIPGKCGVSESNPNLVVGFNNELCEQHVAARMVSTMLKGAGKQSIPSDDEAYRMVQQVIDDDPANKLLQQEANSTTTVARWSINSAIYIFGICILFYTYVRLWLSRGVYEKDQYGGEGLRYGKVAWCLPMLGVGFLMPWAWDDLGDDEYSLFATRVFTTLNMWSDINEAGTISAVVAETQKGSLGAATTEQAKKYDPSYANAKSMAYAAVNAKLLDNRTAKYHFKLANYDLPAGERQTEFQSPFAFFYKDGAISIRRLKDGSVSETDTIAEVGEIETKTSFNLNGSVKSEAANLKAQYMTNDPSQFETMLKGFKASLIQNLGLERPTADVNNAVTVQANYIVQNILSDAMNNQALINKAARLHEEALCTKNAQGFGEGYFKDYEIYLKFLNGEGPARFESAIECIGGKNGSFQIYGHRPLDVVKKERDETYKVLTDYFYTIVTAHSTALVDVTIDESNSNACVKARQGGGPAFALYYPQCTKQSAANKQIINLSANSYTMTGFGEGSYVDSNFALKNSNSLDTLSNDDFDVSMSEMYNSIDVKVDFYKTNQDAYLESLIRGNLGDSDNLMKNIYEIIIKPTATFKQDLGYTDDCKNDFIACVKAENVIPALQNVSEKMIDSGAYIAFFSITASSLSKKFNKSDDKTMEYSKKAGSSNALKTLLKSVELVFSVFTSLGYWMMYLGLFCSYVLAISALFFVVASLLVIIMQIFNLILAGFRFLQLLWPNDKNNIVMGVRKLINEIIYNVTIKSVLIIIQALYYPILGFALMLVAFLVTILAEQGVQQAIVGLLMLGPMLYLTVVGSLKAMISLLDAYSRRFQANGFMTEVLSETLDLCFIIVTFGLPLLFIQMGKAKEKK
ncbi:hypothetical protein [Pseudomonas syringae group genomosp. 3]|uniref:hypothetical protein n=1 Tax=Pseudomonas syringae group genomosp. 3 TaxID=251701 RepID=UPI0011C39069|nr:hypothetical protein [Pseudomonas syringae group genomosp. 3]